MKYYEIIPEAKEGAVVVNQSGKVITAYPASKFDAAMQNLITLFFGG